MTGPVASLSGQIAELELFRGVGPESVEMFLERSRGRSLETGELLLSPDTDNDDLYAVIEGALTVHLNSLSSPALTTIGPGSCAGEMSIIEGERPSAYVVAARPTQLLVIDQKTLWKMINTSHNVARNLLTILSSRLRFDNDFIIDSEGILRQFERNAMTDPLTDLHNRHWQDDMFQRKIQRSRIDGTPLCVAMLDVDHFKEFNDAYGHLRGDEMLCVIADALRDLFRPADFLVRFGGDEFAVMLQDTTLHTAVAVLERVRKGIAERIEASAIGARRVTISGGIAQLNEKDTLDSLIGRADTALYRAKDAGRDCIRTD